MPRRTPSSRSGRFVGSESLAPISTTIGALPHGHIHKPLTEFGNSVELFPQSGQALLGKDRAFGNSNIKDLNPGN